MTTPKKKHLIELMIESGVKWPDGAEYAAQDKGNLEVNFYRDGKPDYKPGFVDWGSDECDFMSGIGFELQSLCRNWHQTIVTREQYEEAVALAAATPSAQQEARESDCAPAADAVEWHNPPSIEQLTSDYHTKAAEADRLQSMADEALKAADDALLALEKAGELIGLVISIDTKPRQSAQEAQPEITDWRDLQVGDVIWVGELPGVGGLQSGEYTVSNVDHSEYNPVHVYNDGESWVVDLYVRKWRFISRP